MTNPRSSERRVVPNGTVCASGGPRAIEVLIKKASVDRTFGALLLEKRDRAAATIGLKLLPSEVAVLRGIPSEQLAAMVRQTKVRPELKPVFRGAAAALMLAALSATGPARAGEAPAPPERPPATEPGQRPEGEGTLKQRMICKVSAPRSRMVAVAGVLPPGWNEPQREWVEFPPQSTPALDKLTAEQVRARVEELLPRLGDEEFDNREQATLRLMQLGPRLLPLIADLKPEDPEAFTRLARIRNALEAAKQAEGHLKLVDGKYEWHVSER